ncbi:hypothetical protein [Rhizobium alvei]|uniref:Uncharacterized protein n=1 Tax=Rhizobium alvei TaxID=1132659 RepID=A0ABT8YIV7_9HYPH|nr:hypothetical protein [Rhizobium alvei]MDO6963605.1 hypothetical protein [Rhizobium alvei]
MTEESSHLFVRNMVASGHLPLDIVKALRKKFNMTLMQAFEMVVTPEEIHVFLDANKKRGVNQAGAVRLLKKVYGLPKVDAAKYVERSGNWSNEANFLSIELRSEEDEAEIDMKGWRGDVTVRANGRTITPTFYQPVRLKQEIEIWERSKDWNWIEEMIILQDSLLNDDIRDRIQRLFKAGYFDE